MKELSKETKQVIYFYKENKIWKWIVPNFPRILTPICVTKELKNIFVDKYMYRAVGKSYLS